MRVTEQMRYDSVSSNLSQLSARQAKAAQESQTGLRVNLPSDDPIAAAELARLRASQGQITARRSTINAVRGDAELAESSLQQASDLLASAKDLALQGGNGALGAAERATLAKQVQDLKEQLLRQRLIRREIQSKIVVTDEEIGKYYQQHRDDYEGKEAVRIKQILFPVPSGSTQSVRDAMRKEAEAIRKNISTPESFDMMAEKYSQGPAAQVGGDLGFIERGQTFPEVEAAAFKMKIDELSNVIETPVGFHIIMVVDKKGAGLKPLTNVRQEILMKIEDQKLALRFDQWIIELRKKAHIEMKL